MKKITLFCIACVLTIYSMQWAFASNEKVYLSLDSLVSVKSNSSFDSIFSENKTSALPTNGMIVKWPRKIIGLNWWQVQSESWIKKWYPENSIVIERVYLSVNNTPKVKVFSRDNDGVFLANGSIDETLQLITTRFISDWYFQTEFLKASHTTTEEVIQQATPVTVSMISSQFGENGERWIIAADFLNIPESVVSIEDVIDWQQAIHLVSSTFEKELEIKAPYWFLAEKQARIEWNGDALPENVVNMITSFFRKENERQLSVGDLLNTPEATIDISRKSENNNSISTITSNFWTYDGYVDPFRRNTPEAEVELSSASEQEPEISTFSSFFDSFTLPWINIFKKTWEQQ